MLGGAKIGDFGGAQRGARSVENDSFILKFFSSMVAGSIHAARDESARNK